VIDAEDVPLVIGFNWTALVGPRAVYACRTGPRPKKQKVLMHRLLMGDPEGLQIDHIDGDGINNRRDNLRIATRSQNLCNQRLNARNKSGFKGVSWHSASAQWQSHIMLHGKSRNLGCFACPTAAHIAYAKASHALHGEFGRIG
jgi:hypothetical protein